MLLPLRSLYESIGATNVTVNLTGVSASPAVGTLRFNAKALITGVSATPAIGTIKSSVIVGVTRVSDNFNRTNGGLGSNWTTCPAHSALAVVSNTCRASATGTFCAQLWSANTFDSDQFSEAVIGTAATSGSEALGLIVRAKAGVDEFYLGFVTSANWQVYLRSAGAYTILASGAAASVPGDVIKLEVIGNAISLYKNGSTITFFTATGGQIITGGNPGIEIFDGGNSLSVDNWFSVTNNVAAVAAFPAIGTGRIKATYTVTGVSATPAVGSLRFNVKTGVTGVAATPAIGTGTVLTPSLGNVFVSLIGVSASPQVGSGTVTIGSVAVTPPETGLVVGGGRWYGRLEDTTVYLTGVSAHPRVGKGVLVEFAKLYPFPRPRVVPQLPRRIAARTPKPEITEKAVPEIIVVRLTGVASVPVVGTGTVKRVYDLLDEEILALLEAA